MATGQARWFVHAFRRAACVYGRSSMCQGVARAERRSRWRHARKNRKRNILSLAPSWRQYKQEGRANLARRARACARI